MPLETVHFDRVFGVVQTSQNRKRVTLFGFESGSRKEYSVAAPGRPRVESGMTITAYLSKADNWQTLVGWRDHESGEIVCESDGASIFLCVSCILAFCIAAPEMRYQSAVSYVIALMFIAVFACSVRDICYLRRVRRELEVAATS